MDAMDADLCGTPAATASATQDLAATNTEEEEELPLLFVDQLPSNFQQSAQLAAIATFMADSDDDAAVDEAPEAGNGRKQRLQRQKRPTRTRRRQRPYIKPALKDQEPKNRENRDESASTKELQLFLSMFHVS